MSNVELNIVQQWLYLIRTKDRAERMLLILPAINPPMCPLAELDCVTIDSITRQCYRKYGRALDSWDNGCFTPLDLKRVCRYIAEGWYARDQQRDQ